MIIIIFRLIFSYYMVCCTDSKYIKRCIPFNNIVSKIKQKNVWFADLSKKTQRNNLIQKYVCYFIYLCFHTKCISSSQRRNLSFSEYQIRFNRKLWNHFIFFNCVIENKDENFGEILFELNVFVVKLITQKSLYSIDSFWII